MSSVYTDMGLIPLAVSPFKSGKSGALYGNGIVYDLKSGGRRVAALVNASQTRRGQRVGAAVFTRTQ